ncbi:uncharacterized protein [Diabrotica undecimpunctata]|uniref:uncharacterized protein n=1 Tax=Diabrotica undecimpunctata TaxID=50387 RepID=UPI003B635B74
MKTEQRSARREPGLLAKKRILFESVPEFAKPQSSSVSPSSVCKSRFSIASPCRCRAPSEESVVFVGAKKISEAQRLIYKINLNKKKDLKKMMHSAAIVETDQILHAAEKAANYSEISDSEEETLSDENLPSIEDILEVSDRESPPREKPLTETQVWEKKLLSNSEPSLINVAASALQIPKKVETHHQAFCENYKGGVVSALEQHAERLQESLNESLKNSELLKKATENILAYAEKISAAFHEEQIRFAQDIKNTKTFLANTVRTDSRDFFNKNAGGDILRCWGMSKPSHPDDPVM